LGIGDWAQSPIPNPQSPNLLSYIVLYLCLYYNLINLTIYYYSININLKITIIKMYSDNETKSVIIWVNGKTFDKSMTMKINSKVNSLRRLKDAIINFVNKNIPHDKILIYNNKAILYDDADIEYINDNQILYVALDGKSTKLNNYTKLFNT